MCTVHVVCVLYSSDMLCTRVLYSSVVCAICCISRASFSVSLVDIPGVVHRVATITGPPMGDGCQRAQKMIDDIVREVRTKWTCTLVITCAVN